MRKTWLGLSLFVPLGVLWAASYFRAVYLVGRYDLVAYPPFPILLGLVLGKLNRVKRAGILLASLAGLLLLIPVGVKLVPLLSDTLQRRSPRDRRASSQCRGGW